MGSEAHQSSSNKVSLNRRLNSRNLPPLIGIAFQSKKRKDILMKYTLIVATVMALATPALAEEVGVGVGVGPVGAGVTVGEGHRDFDRDRRDSIYRD
jgi:hypothetical protein